MAAPTAEEPDRPRVVILGAGFGGLTAAKSLRRAQAQVTTIDRRNNRLFQPPFYQVATATLSPDGDAAPDVGLRPLPPGCASGRRLDELTVKNEKAPVFPPGLSHSNNRKSYQRGAMRIAPSRRTVSPLK